MLSTGSSGRRKSSGSFSQLMVVETAVGEGIKACTIGLNFHQDTINSLRNF
jgi:hypothetical protein